MTQSIDIPVKETDLLRIFALNLPEAEVKTLKETPNRVAAWMGQEAVDTNYVEVIRFADVAEMGLAPYLQEGYDADATALAKDAAKLSKLSGYGVVMLSSALQQRPTTIMLGAELTLIGTYPLAGTNWQPDLADVPESATPYSAPEDARKKRPSDAAMSGRIATIALLVLALLVILMVWIA